MTAFSVGNAGFEIFPVDVMNNKATQDKKEVHPNVSTVKKLRVQLNEFVKNRELKA